MEALLLSIQKKRVSSGVIHLESANQRGSSKTSGVIFATESKCTQIRDNTPNAGDTHGPAPRMQAVPLVQEAEVTQGTKTFLCGCSRYCTH